MSAQGFNSTVLNSNATYGFVPTPGAAGQGIPAGPYVTHFASDHTKRIKEAALYRYYAGTAVTGGSPLLPLPSPPFLSSPPYRIVQSNQNRKTYQFGAMACSGCTGGFPVVSIGVEQPS
jgi:hypothetical protein